MTWLTISAVLEVFLFCLELLVRTERFEKNITRENMTVFHVILCIPSQIKSIVEMATVLMVYRFS